MRRRGKNTSLGFGPGKAKKRLRMKMRMTTLRMRTTIWKSVSPPGGIGEMSSL